MFYYHKLEDDNECTSLPQPVAGDAMCGYKNLDIPPAEIIAVEDGDDCEIWSVMTNFTPRFFYLCVIVLSLQCLCQWNSILQRLSRSPDLPTMPIKTTIALSVVLPY